MQNIFRTLDLVMYRVYRPWLHFDFMLHFSSDGRKHMTDIKELHFIANQVGDT